jgi:hypothetical protein
MEGTRTRQVQVPKRWQQVLAIRTVWTTPAGWLFMLIAALVLTFLAFADRPSSLSDQENYVAYFRNTNWDWLVLQFHESPSVLRFFISLVTDELGWRSWVILANCTGMAPETGVRLTVLCFHAMIIFALSRLQRPLLGLLLYLVIPIALPTLVFQIRQGFGFGLAMMFAIVFKRPLLGAIIGSSVHTTLAVPAIIMLAFRLFRHRLMAAIAAASAAAVMLAWVGPLLFRAFGGRRAEIYTVQQDNFSIRLLALMILYLAAPILLLYTTRREQRSSFQDSLQTLAVMHIGLIVYLVAAFALFPFGKDRVWYYVPLLLPFLLPEIRMRNLFVLWTFAGVIALVLIDAVKNYFEGTYFYFLG